MQQPNVHLLRAHQVIGSGQFYHYSDEIFIRIRNITPQKKVTIWFRHSNGNWSGKPAYYLVNFNNEQELWCSKNRGQGRGAAPFEFAIKYEAGGHVYWDNNFGKNYTLDLCATKFIVNEDDKYLSKFYELRKNVQLKLTEMFTNYDPFTDGNILIIRKSLHDYQKKQEEDI